MALRAPFLQEVREEARLLHRLPRKTAGIGQALEAGAALSPRGVWTAPRTRSWVLFMREAAARGEGMVAATL